MKLVKTICQKCINQMSGKTHGDTTWIGWNERDEYRWNTNHVTCRTSKLRDLVGGTPNDAIPPWCKYPAEHTVSQETTK